MGLVAGAATAAGAQSSRARVTQLNDLAFGQLSGLSDAYLTDDVCAFSTTSGYLVTASGSGSGGAFSLASASATLPYEVMWAAASGQTSGTALAAGVTSPAFTSGATQQSCNSGPPASATLIVVIRANAISSAQAGAYQGTLSITIAPQ